jgi:hypothetical protein
MYGGAKATTGLLLVRHRCNPLTRLVALFAIAFGLQAHRPVVAQSVSAEAVKATFLYRFAGYVEWPPSMSEVAFTIGVVDNEPVAEHLDRLLATITIHGLPARWKRLRAGDSLEGIHVLYVGASNSIHARLLRKDAVKKTILLVSDSPRGLADGAVINFLGSSRTVRFEVSLPNATRSGLRIDSRLLSVATRVEGMSQTSSCLVPRPQPHGHPSCAAPSSHLASFTSIGTAH